MSRGEDMALSFLAWFVASAIGIGGALLALSWAVG
jgi:hypothetical protein